MKKALIIAIVACCFGLMYLLANYDIILTKYRLSKFKNITLIDYQLGEDDITVRFLVKAKSKNIELEMIEFQNTDNKYFVQSVNKQYVFQIVNDKRIISNDKGCQWDKVLDNRLIFSIGSEYNDIFQLKIHSLEDLVNNVDILDSCISLLPEYSRDFTPKYYTNDSTIEMYYFKARKNELKEICKRFENDTILKFKYHN